MDLKKIKIVSRNNKLVHDDYEDDEVTLLRAFIQEADKVIELGGRLGKSSCVINKLLKTKRHHVVIEPNKSVLNLLETNRDNNNCKFQILDKILGNGTDKFNLHSYHAGKPNKFSISTQTKLSNNSDADVDSITYSDVCKKYKIIFNVLVADCEGCLEYVVRSNETMLINMRMVIFEKDGDCCDYSYVSKKLKESGLTEVTRPFSRQQIWIKTN